MDNLVLEHDHHFIIDSGKAEQRTKLVVLLTLMMMIIEITAGYLFGSMALLADGWHMGTHAAALGIALFAYIFARKHKDNPSYTFGTGKVGDLGGFTSAIVLVIVSVMMIYESVARFINPVEIKFDEAIIVAGIGLVVNILSALILQGHHQHQGEEDNDHFHHHDNNLRAAYIHVIADALTSVLAIIALLAGRVFGWVWLDPAMGIVGGLVILKWAAGLIKVTSRILLDSSVHQKEFAKIKDLIENAGNNKVTDLHLWQVGPQHIAAILSISSPSSNPPEFYKKLIKDKCPEISHISVEINQI